MELSFRNQVSLVPHNEWNRYNIFQLISLPAKIMTLNPNDNIFQILSLPKKTDEECFETIFSSLNILIERIIWTNYSSRRMV